jgi:hypothetical protein
VRSVLAAALSLTYVAPIKTASTDALRWLSGILWLHFTLAPHLGIFALDVNADHRRRLIRVEID